MARTVAPYRDRHGIADPSLPVALDEWAAQRSTPAPGADLTGAAISPV